MSNIIKYNQCQGCYSYKESKNIVSGCPYISELHKDCPCQTCLIKIVCDTMCTPFIKCKDKAYMAIENRIPTGLNCG